MKHALLQPVGGHDVAEDRSGQRSFQPVREWHRGDLDGLLGQPQQLAFSERPPRDAEVLSRDTR
jgi:hypothetical protein